MIVINGSQGEGGGQIFRTSLSLAMCLNKPVRIENIRAGRAKPGLLRQHLTCLRAAQSICAAQVTGDELGSREVSFTPGKVRAGEYRFAVGSAGSTSLVFQTLLMPLIFSGASSALMLEGGTHNGFAPSFDFINIGFLPAIARMGYQADAELSRFGFYPAGGGAWRAQIHPAQGVKALDLTQRGGLKSRLALATSSQIPKHITERELAQVQKKCLWCGDELQQRIVDSVGPGNIVSLRAISEHVTEVVEVVGEKQLSAERVAGRAAKAMNSYLAADVTVGEYLADQLLLPMVLGKGGQFTTQAPSKHFLSNVEVIKQFMAVDISVEQRSEHVWQVRV
ncbi:MAG: RNA 3'-terminal phosphate cyclase [Cellvibrionaceae bacterium]|nr:RNA 3'-terminal phosphate cyclase [Cellvibrionaceae bacterium]